MARSTGPKRKPAVWSLPELIEKATSKKGVSLREFLEHYLRPTFHYSNNHLITMVVLVEKWKQRRVTISEFSHEFFEGFTQYMERKCKKLAFATKLNRASDFKVMWHKAELIGLAPPSGVGANSRAKLDHHTFRIPVEHWLERPLNRDEISVDTPLPAVVVNSLFKLNFRIQSDKTRYYYRQVCRDYADYLQRVPLVSDLNDDCVAGFMAWLRDHRALTSISINDRRKCIVALWTFLCKLGVLDRWPLIPKMPEPDPVPKAWTIEQLDLIFTAAAKQRGKINGAPAGLWWQSLVSALWDTGERIGAMLSVRWTHVDLPGRWMHVPADIRKGKRKSRSYRLSETTCKLLNALASYAATRVHVWNRSTHHSVYYTGFGRILKSAGLPADRGSKFHRIRRSVCSHAEALGINSTELLGHTDRKTTIKSYVDRTIAPERQAVDILRSLGSDAVPEHRNEVDMVQLVAQLSEQVAKLTAALAEKGGAA